MHELALFAGAGGGILGGKLLGWRTVCAVEIEPYPRSVLLARQDDGNLEPFPVWDDVRTFDGRPWRGVVDIVTGGFPCQDISTGNTDNAQGIDGERSGLWREMARIVGEVGPSYVLVENSPALTFRGLGRVLGDLAALGYDARWGVLAAAECGTPHRRERIWILANSVQNGQLARGPRYDGTEGSRRDTEERCENRFLPEMASALRRTLDKGWENFPDAARAIDDVANWVDRLAATGNGQCPPVVALAWHLLNPSADQRGVPSPLEILEVA